MTGLWAPWKVAFWFIIIVFTISSSTSYIGFITLGWEEKFNDLLFASSQDVLFAMQKLIPVLWSLIMVIPIHLVFNPLIPNCVAFFFLLFFCLISNFFYIILYAALRAAAAAVKHEDDRRLFHNAALRKRRKEVGDQTDSIRRLNRVCLTYMWFFPLLF